MTKPARMNSACERVTLVKFDGPLKTSKDMQRFWSIATVIFLCLSQFAPTALATAVVVNPHACCLRVTAQHDHCGKSQAGISAQPQCHHNCPSVAFSNSVRRLASARPIADAPADAHPFLSEFYPAEASDTALDSDAQRAPPALPSR